jgi:hypothetical protein
MKLKANETSIKVPRRRKKGTEMKNKTYKKLQLKD